MHLFIKGDLSRNILFDYLYLAHKMWFDKKDGKELQFGYGGRIEPFMDDPTINLILYKEDHDVRWRNVTYKEGISYFESHMVEYICLGFEDAPATNYMKKGEHLRIVSSHLDLLTVDKRAMIIMAIEVAQAIDGYISEDRKTSWLSVEDFKKKHIDVLSMTYEEANELSLQEISSIDVVDDPIWAEDDLRYESYRRQRRQNRKERRAIKQAALKRKVKRKRKKRRERKRK